MRMKTYAGRSLAEIVPQIRDELGSGAVILKQRPIRTGGGIPVYVHGTERNG